MVFPSCAFCARPELLVRRMVHSLGYRFRLHRKDLPGKPDLAFIARRKVIFVHGCFWHQHQSKNCRISHVPKSSINYWLPKLERNARRDAEHTKALKAAGWRVMVVWECEGKKRAALERRLQKFLG